MCGEKLYNFSRSVRIQGSIVELPHSRLKIGNRECFLTEFKINMRNSVPQIVEMITGTDDFKRRLDSFMKVWSICGFKP